MSGDACSHLVSSRQNERDGQMMIVCWCLEQIVCFITIAVTIGTLLSEEIIAKNNCFQYKFDKSYPLCEAHVDEIGSGKHFISPFS